MELFVQHVCPLIKLWKDPSSRRFWCGDRKYQFGIAGDFAAILIIVLVAVLLCCYVFLTISSETLTYSEDGHGVKMQQKEPESGQHMVFVLIACKCFALVLLSHICGFLTEQVKPANDFNGICDWLGKHVGKSWFFSDYLLLCVGFFPSVVFQIYLWIQKHQKWRDCFQKQQRFDQNDITDLKLPHYQIWIHIDAFLSLYLAAMVSGFLFIALEYRVKVNPDHRAEFNSAMLLLIVLWSVNFLTIQDDRYIYAAAWGDRMHPILRAMAALAQVFITHSAVMLGAVFLGHSEHEHPTRGHMPRKFLWCSFLPSLVVLIGIVWCCSIHHRHQNDDASCLWGPYHVIIQMWRWPESLLPILVGLFLFVISLWESCLNKNEDYEELTPTAHGQGEREANHPADTPPERNHRKESPLPSTKLVDYDYDSLLMLVTVCFSLLFYVNKIYEMKAARSWINFGLAILELSEPIGLVTFAFYTWKMLQPQHDAHDAHDAHNAHHAHHANPRRTVDCGGWCSQRCRLLSAFVYAGAMFTIFQLREDCETSSDLPQCCGYPVRSSDVSRVTCNKELRCTELSPLVEVNQTCALPYDFNASVARGILKVKKVNGAECEALKSEWDKYRRNEFGKGHSAMQDAEEEEDKYSHAFRLFRTVGQAACVEMFFTIAGVLLKLIFLTADEHMADVGGVADTVDTESARAVPLQPMVANAATPSQAVRSNGLSTNPADSPTEGWQCVPSPSARQEDQEASEEVAEG